MHSMLLQLPLMATAYRLAGFAYSGHNNYVHPHTHTHTQCLHPHPLHVHTHTQCLHPTHSTSTHTEARSKLLLLTWPANLRLQDQLFYHLDSKMYKHVFNTCMYKLTVLLLYINLIKGVSPSPPSSGPVSD